jgi:hypothetical protein
MAIGSSRWRNQAVIAIVNARESQGRSLPRFKVEPIFSAG